MGGVCSSWRYVFPAILRRPHTTSQRSALSNDSSPRLYLFPFALSSSAQRRPASICSSSSPNALASTGLKSPARCAPLQLRHRHISRSTTAAHRPLPRRFSLFSPQSCRTRRNTSRESSASPAVHSQPCSATPANRLSASDFCQHSLWRPKGWRPCRHRQNSPGIQGASASLLPGLMS